MFSKLAKCSFFFLLQTIESGLFCEEQISCFANMRKQMSSLQQSPIVIRTVDFNNKQKLSNLIIATAFTTCSWRLLTCLWRDEGMARILTDELSILQGNNFCWAPAQLLFNTKQPEAVFKEKHGVWDPMTELNITQLIS
jgi:hypothetical protein